MSKNARLLAQAGYPDGLKLDLHTTDTGNRRDLAVVLKEQWAEAGIDVMSSSSGERLLRR